MAKATGHLSSGLSGQLGKELVFKQYAGGRTVVTKFPDMSNIKPSKKQKAQRSLFAEAVAYAKLINSDPEKKKAYQKKVKRGQTVFQYAIKEFMNRRGK